MDKEFYYWLGNGFGLLFVFSGVALLVRRRTKVERSRADDWIGISLLFSILGFGACVLWPVIASTRPATDTATRQGRLMAWHTAIIMYASDYDDHLPLLENWEESLNEYLKYGSSVTLRDPVSSLEKGFGYNAAVAGRSLDECPSNTVLLISGQNAQAIERGGEIVSDPSAVVITLDGGVQPISYDKLAWSVPAVEDTKPDNLEE